MTPFRCTRCHAAVFFENGQCGQCQAWLGYVPREQGMQAFDAPSDPRRPWNRVGQGPTADGPALRACGNRVDHAVCNWMLDEGDDQMLCISCRLNRVIPDLSVPGHLERWAAVEQAKRRLLVTLDKLGLPVHAKRDDDDTQGLAFDILAPQPDAKAVLTGHDTGFITLNLQEADDVHRETTRVAFGEPWRTLLGHLRHEASHYLQHRWLADDEEAMALCRQVFGDERQDYGQALARYHEHGPVADWQDSHISPYASSHPFEDWAETCAHVLLVTDAVETAAAWGLRLDSPTAQAAPAEAVMNRPAASELVLSQWLPVAQFLNAMNRSLGLHDSYPFLLPGPVLNKMAVVDQLLRRAAVASSSPVADDSGAVEPGDPAPLVSDRNHSPTAIT
jgi:hypothetical protein